MGWTAGVATADITPDLDAGPVHLAGYGDRVGPATAVHEPIDVRVLVVSDDGAGPLVLVVFDLLLLSREQAEPIRAAVADAVGVPLAAVVLSCVHLHAAPSTVNDGERVGWPIAAGYIDQVRAAAVGAARAAVASAEPVVGSFGRASLAPGVAVNRRGHPFEPSVAVLELLTGDGRRLATVVNVGMHPTVGGPANTAVSTDWVGPCRRRLEAELGGTAVVVQGCGGDVNPAVTAWDGGEPADWAPVAAQVGGEVADAALAARRRGRPVTGEIAAPERRVLTVPLDADTLLSALAGRSDEQLELVTWHLGALTLLTVPGEGFHHLEQAVRAARGDRVLLIGLAPSWHGYLPVPFEEGYEESLSYGAGAVAAVGAALVESAPASAGSAPG